MARFGKWSSGASARADRVVRAAAPVLSLAVLAAALVQLARLDWHAIGALVPRDPVFWAVFAAMYLVPIVGDWLIYRRLWGMPASGMVPLARKLVGNELLLGYVGDAYLVAWARGRGREARAALATVGDVAILSAAVGAGLTIAIALAAAPQAGPLGLPVAPWLVAASLGLVAAPPLAALVVRRRMSRLALADWRPVAAVHAVRAVATVGLTALLWHLALPAVAVGAWLVLAALRMLVARLPFASNKDVVFAAIAVAVVGGRGEVGGLMTMMAALLAAAHVVVGLAAAAAGVIADGRVLAAPVAA